MIIPRALLRFFHRRADSMGMPAEVPYYTVEMVRAIPDDRNRYEAVHGELLVSPSPRRTHQVVVGSLFLELAPYVRRWGLGQVLVAPFDLVHGRTSLVVPDVLVLRAGAEGEAMCQLRDAILLVEVLSPSSRKPDRFTKRRLYQEAGVPAYWMVDVDSGAVEVWTPADEFPRVEREQVEWRPAGAGEGLVLSLDRLLRTT
ncbi:MAG TPA: Uma2 family endonuclease [Gemmatimonadales bacterium]|nr:Uma2 family endonuclease [Gemmatimonadales bacterium]